MRKKWLIAGVFVALVGIFAATAYASNPIKLIVNGRETKLDVPPHIIHGRIMVPVRWIAEMLGATVYWNEKEKLIGIDFTLPPELQKEWEYPLPGGGELSLGYLGRGTKFILPVIVTLNEYLAEKQKASLYPTKDDAAQTILVRYELLSAGRTDGGMWYSEKTAYKIVARLYYSEIQPEKGHPPHVIRLYEQELPKGGIAGGNEELKFNRHWYEDTQFIVKPKEGTVVERDDSSGRTTWIQGQKGWYIDESETRVLKKKELEEMPVLFDYPHPPAGYDYTLLKQQ
ncbi:Copper amine oxidase N-terminal domain-containing protein [Desulfofundulus australicus DSM 11792]|uniref:Copper amine oxidase N-terminal domain-containing protein n=1 Tax=Desulfofundulus australicus DSM 11792 TaxID=1121425 RepID=A0A1M4U964_9FIRM|nr:copper amine oxidase N-terminal domain-containing protein [Desulfofundulus australicus]SHE53103.1 Copper amine oxidase N-terminal domain-containing protein [Desulfofundulus australicus DSM 11792]